MNRRSFLKSVGVTALATSAGTSYGQQNAKAPLNILLFTADDLAADSLGCYGSTVPDTSPNLDRFAQEAVRFMRGHVTVAICQPSRGVLATGKYPQNSGILGFMHTGRDIPTTMETFDAAGYMTGVLGKVGHSTPHENYQWDYVKDQPELGAGRSPRKYYEACTEFFARCKAENKPFYFMVNSHDPHRPYHVPGVRTKKLAGAEEPSRLYTPEEVTVPGFLPELPDVRLELSYYFNSVRRLDDTFGKAMQALDESGYRDNTLVVFLSDNGIAVPFAKCNTYLASTRTPLMVRYPALFKQGWVDKTHFVPSLDFMPTILEAAGLPPADHMDGRSFLPLLLGEEQTGRDHVFTQIDRKAGGGAVPMRCVQNAKFGYIFNCWSDGEYEYHNNNEGMTWKAMVEAARTDPAIAARTQVFRLRSVEELYDLENDPNCTKNLVDNPEYKEQLATLRAQLVQQMRDSNDPMIDVFAEKDEPDALRKAFRALYPEEKEKKHQDE